MHSYALAAEKSERRGVDMALARLALGRLYFERADYDHAQPCYAEAVALLPETFEGIRQIRDRSDVLDELAVYSRTVSLNDSLLRLADMPETDLYQSDRRHHRACAAKSRPKPKRRNDSNGGGGRRQQRRDRRFHHLGQRIGAHGIHPPERRRVMVFLQPSGHRGGRAEFRRRWGTRKPEDNWRRSDKAAYAAIDDTDTNDDPQGAQSATAASDPHERAYYLAQIPTDSLSRRKPMTPYRRVCSTWG